jgi:hypothetical protein
MGAIAVRETRHSRFGGLGFEPTPRRARRAGRLRQAAAFLAGLPKGGSKVEPPFPPRPASAPRPARLPRGCCRFEGAKPGLVWRPSDQDPKVGHYTHAGRPRVLPYAASVLFRP